MFTCKRSAMIRPESSKVMVQSCNRRGESSRLLGCRSDLTKPVGLKQDEVPQAQYGEDRGMSFTVTCDSDRAWSHITILAGSKGADSEACDGRRFYGVGSARGWFTALSRSWRSRSTSCGVIPDARCSNRRH